MSTETEKVVLTIMKNETSYKFMSFQDLHLAFSKYQRSSSYDKKSNPVMGTHNVPEVQSSFVVGYSLNFEPTSFVDQEICVTKYNDLCNVHFYRTQMSCPSKHKPVQTHLLWFRPMVVLTEY